MARDTNLEHLHPIVRDNIQRLTQALSDENLPFKLFEGFRSPERQAELYAQGRSKPGQIVTKAKAWSSYHQYGVAGDFVLYENGRWSWDDRGKRRQWWEKLHELARGVGLKPLGWETPHLQLQNIKIADLRAGSYPEGGDEQWENNLEDAIQRWRGPPSSPPLVNRRPPMDITLQPEDTDSPSPVSTNTTRYQVIARNGLRLREGPSTSFDVVSTLASGQVVNVIAFRGDWYQIDVENDGLADGYCHGGYLKLVE